MPNYMMTYRNFNNGNRYGDTIFGYDGNQGCSAQISFGGALIKEYNIFFYKRSPKRIFSLFRTYEERF